MKSLKKPIEAAEHELKLMEQNPRVYHNWTDPENRVTKGRAIRLKCLDCCAGSGVEVRLCHTLTCPLWPYRMAKEDRTWYPWPGVDPDMRRTFSPLAK